MSRDVMVETEDEAFGDVRPEAPASPVPLIVDLDGTLVKTDLLHEDWMRHAPRGLSHHVATVRALRTGKQVVKQYLAAGRTSYDLLPYDEAVIDLIRSARADGRQVHLVSACHRDHAEGVARHLDLFDEVVASDETVNLSGRNKARVLVQRFGSKGFDYIGNSRSDLFVWAEANKAYVIRASKSVRQALDRLGVPVEQIHHSPATIHTWMHAFRIHQYIKNSLVFVPLLTAHAFAIHDVVADLAIFVSFCLCASAVYIINDLLDIDADRLHPSKKRRPFASGAIPIAQGVVASLLLLLVSFAIALSTSLAAAGVLACYFALTNAYSVWLKRKMIVDVVALAMLYTVRIIGGAAAISVPVSEWLLGFSVFIFFSLALMKRYVELVLRIDKELPNPSNRNYQLSDAGIVAALAAASGLNAVTVFSLYLSSPDVQQKYTRPLALWLICPILVYWISRSLMLAHRRIMNDDPIVFALRDRVSRIAIICMVVIVFVAI